MTDDLNSYPVLASRPDSAEWIDYHSLGEQLTERFPEQDADQFAAMLSYNEHPLSDAEIAALECTRYGERDTGPWVWLVTTVDGRTWSVEASCDFTGWDCQSEAEWTEVACEVAR